MRLPPPPADLARLALAVREGFGRRGAEVDAFFEVSSRQSATLRLGERVVTRSISEHGLLVRCAHAHGRASFSTSDVGAAGVRGALDRAGLPGGRARFALSGADARPRSITGWIERARELVAGLEASGFSSAMVRVEAVDRTRFSCTAGEAARGSRTPFVTLEVHATSGDAREAGVLVGLDAGEVEPWSPASLIRTLRSRVRGRRAAPTPVGATEVVLAPGLSGIVFHELVGHPLEADSALAGISLVAARLGRRVAPSFVTVRDLPRARGAVDDEGAPEVAVTLLDRGRPAGLLHDRLTAEALGVGRTGNGRSAGWADEPIPRMRVLSVDAGPHDARALVGDVREGLYIEEIREGLSDLSTGRFMLPITRARRIVRGKLEDVVTGGRLSGDVLSALRKVRGVAGDVRDFEEPVMCVKRVVVPTAARGPTVYLGRVMVE